MRQEIIIQRITFNQVTKEWLMYIKTKVKESTYLHYKNIAESKFLNVFGLYTLEELLKIDFNVYINRISKKQSPRSVRITLIVLKEILKYAELKYDVDFKLELISMPKIPKKNVEIFDKNERIKLLNYCLNDDNFKSLGILICLYTGLRIGEICALRWKDIDFENQLIWVNQTCQRVYKGKNNTKVVISDPKTDSSNRGVPIASNLSKKLIKERKGHDKEDFILSCKYGKVIEPANFRYYYKKTLKELDVEYKTFHTLRHTFATNCINVGMDVKSLSEILGHANVSTTLNIYVHSSISKKQEYLNKL